MRRVGVVLLWAAVGFVAAALAGYGLVTMLSSNTHDRSVEAAMTAIFVCGPLGALAAGVWAFIRR